jgi:ElaB/YqjD/DUF883 family membrane-anchored ribosome-binding protein
MGQGQGKGGSDMTDMSDPEQIREQIAATREELGDTVEALAEKTDVSAQAKRKLQETKTTVADKRDEVIGKVKTATPDSAAAAAGQAGQTARRNPVPVAAAGAFALGFLLGRVSRR